MSSIMRARSGLTGRFEDWEVIGGSSLKPKVAGPSMLGIGCPNRHAFLFTRSPTPPENPPTSTPPSRESGFVRCVRPVIQRGAGKGWVRVDCRHYAATALTARVG